jgi:putative peptide zinc metalloprotease protein
MAGSPAGPAPRPLLGLALRGPVLPKVLVRRCAGPLRRLFHTPVIIVVLAAFAALELTLWRNHTLNGAVTGLLRKPGALVGVVALTLVAAAFHELGHAAAGLYGGAEPGVIGIGIYLIWPVFYNDIDDSYRLDRPARLRVDLGGVYFNLCLMLVEGISYVVTRSPLLLVAIAVQHVLVLQQFLPFVRLDGYYLVSDLAGVPDLFGRIRPIVGSLLPGRPPSALVTQLKTSARVVVTAWVLLTVPLLGALLALFVLRLPGLTAAFWDSIRIYGRSLVKAGRDGAPWSATLDAFQMLLLLVPPVGIGFTVAHGLRSRLTKVGEPR